MVSTSLECRAGCGACCIEPSINEPFWGMPLGKPAGARCVHLDDQFRCALFASPHRPEVCKRFLPSIEVCGASRGEALEILRWMEIETKG